MVSILTIGVSSKELDTLLQHDNCETAGRGVRTRAVNNEDIFVFNLVGKISNSAASPLLFQGYHDNYLITEYVDPFTQGLGPDT